MPVQHTILTHGEIEIFKEDLCKILAQLVLTRRFLTLDAAIREQIQELASVLSGIVFERVGKNISLQRTRIAIELFRREGEAMLRYLLVVWDNGDVHILDSQMQVYDLDMSI